MYALINPFHLTNVIFNGIVNLEAAMMVKNGWAEWAGGVRGVDEQLFLNVGTRQFRHCAALRFTALHCIALHCAVLRCTVLPIRRMQSIYQ